jgi:hypothetical protein
LCAVVHGLQATQDTATRGCVEGHSPSSFQLRRSGRTSRHIGCFGFESSEGQKGDALPLASRSAPGLAIGVFITPQRISIGLGKSRMIWIGVVEITGGPAQLISRLLVLKAWLVDPSLQLVAAEADLIRLAQLEFP